MKKTIELRQFLFLFFVLGSLIIQAQEYKNFDLNKYYTPDIVRNSLDLNLHLSNNFQTNKYANDSTKSNSFSWDFRPNFLSYKSNRALISTKSVRIRTDGSFGKSGKIHDDFSRNSFYTENSLDLNYSTYFYNKNESFFLLQLNANLSSVYNKSNLFTDGRKYNEIGNLNYSIKPYVGIGKGRLELVTDARQAVYILDELYKKGKLKQELTDMQIFEFAQVISKVKNKRFLDARLRKIEEITTVDSFLLKNNYLTNQDATYFTTLYDFWENGALYDRYSGQSLELNISPNIGFENKLNKTYLHQNGDFNSTKHYNGELNLQYSYEKSIGLNWQHSIYAKFGTVFSAFEGENKNDINVIEKSEGTISDGMFYVGYRLSFYPSTRTRLMFSANSYNKLKVYDNISVNDVTHPKRIEKDFNVGGGVYLDYYISQQLRFSVSTGTNLIINNLYNDEKIFLYGIEASIFYSIF